MFAEVIGDTREQLLDHRTDEFDEKDLAILLVSARFVSQALQEAEDITLLEGEKS